MLKGIWNLFLYRILGGRIMLAVAAFGFVRRLLSGRKDGARVSSGGRRTTTPTSTPNVRRG